ncbi:MAG: GNAT family N-acetyltransferase [Minicystis sp.]
MDITIRLLDSSEAAALGAMTFPRFRKGLGAPRTIAVGALTGGDCVGLGLASLPGAPDRRGEVLSIFVAAEHRGRGLATGLLGALEQALAAAGVASAELSFASDKPTTPAFERVLAKRGWAAPRASTYIGRADRRVRSAPWAQTPLPEGMELFPWTALRPEERAAIEARGRDSGWYPEELSPFAEDEILDPVTSVGARRGGEVIGWMVNHRVAPGTIRYSTLFVDPALRDRGCGVALCGAAVCRQDWDAMPIALCAVKADNKAMLLAMRGNLAAYLAVTETRVSTRDLTA